MGTLGIIPAAGNGSRWGGRVKSLLPIANDTTLMDHTIGAMMAGGADAVVIVCSVDNVAQIADMVTAHTNTHRCPNVSYKIQQGGGDMWGAMLEGMTTPADYYLFAMPDTVYNRQAFARRADGDFVLSTFETDRPERFGTLRRGMVVNKAPGDDWHKYQAWGLLGWSAAVVDLWRRTMPDDYTAAINAAIIEYGLTTWDIGHYHDMATFADYREYISHV